MLVLGHIGDLVPMGNAPGLDGGIVVIDRFGQFPGVHPKLLGQFFYRLGLGIGYMDIVMKNTALGNRRITLGIEQLKTHALRLGQKVFTEARIGQVHIILTFVEESLSVHIQHQAEDIQTLGAFIRIFPDRGLGCIGVDENGMATGPVPGRLGPDIHGHL